MTRRRNLAVQLLDAAAQTIAHGLVWAWFRLCRVRST
jgi:hypothetical protein